MAVAVTEDDFSGFVFDGEPFVPIRATRVKLAMILCPCGRSFQGNDARRVREHSNRHARRCTWARKARRIVKSAKQSAQEAP
jgi:hypothetical protein